MSVCAVIIAREPKFPMEGGKPWRVVLDKAVVGQVEPMGGLTVTVDAGRHSLRLERSWLLRSATRSFKLRDGQTVNFSGRCKPYRLLFPLFWPVALLRRDTWISLKPYDPTIDRV